MVISETSGLSMIESVGFMSFPRAYTSFTYWLNSRADWTLLPWLAANLGRRKRLNLKNITNNKAILIEYTV